MLSIKYTGTRDIELHEGTFSTKPFKVRATSETGNAVRQSMTWRFEGEDGTEYRIQIQERRPSNPSSAGLRD